jgi:hypothetical protein
VKYLYTFLTWSLYELTQIRIPETCKADEVIRHFIAIDWNIESFPIEAPTLEDLKLLIAEKINLRGK